MKRQAAWLVRFLLLSASLADNLKKLVLPDQDILNALYADRTVFLDPIRYNFDVRYYPALHALSLGKISVETIPQSTCIVHYCGKHKPWHGQAHLLLRL